MDIWFPRPLRVDNFCYHPIMKNAHSAITYTLYKRKDHVRVEKTDDTKYFRFMCVRHPLDRLVSAWSFFFQREYTGKYQYMLDLGYKRGMSFNDFLDIVLEKHELNAHTAKQDNFRYGHSIDMLCPTEKLTEVWQELKAEFSLPPLEMQNTNPSKHSVWTEYYTASQQSKAEQVFAEDMNLYEDSINGYS